MMRSTSLKAIGYIRVSTEEQQLEGVSLAAQEQRVRAYCALVGLELVRIVRDEGVSGSIPLLQRPQGQDLLTALASAEATNVVGVKLDRLFRSALDCLQNVEDWDRGGVALHLLDFGGQAINTRSATGKLFLTMLAAFAEFERNQTSERTIAALATKKARGDRLGRTPIGFTTPEPGAPMIPHLGELEPVRVILRRRKRRVPYRKIAAELNEAGLRTKTGKLWHPSGVRDVWMGRKRYEVTLAKESRG